MNNPEEEHDPGKKLPFEAILDVLRMRLGLEEDDPSGDTLIANYTPRKALEECVGWRFGDPAWAGEFLKWAKAAGYKISE